MHVFKCRHQIEIIKWQFLINNFCLKQNSNMCFSFHLKSFLLQLWMFKFSLKNVLAARNTKLYWINSCSVLEHANLFSSLFYLTTHTHNTNWNPKATIPQTMHHHPPANNPPPTTTASTNCRTEPAHHHNTNISILGHLFFSFFSINSQSWLNFDYYIEIEIDFSF